MSVGASAWSPHSLSHAFAGCVAGYVNVPMAHYTSLRAGGPADLLLMPADVDELRAIVVCATAQSVPLTWLGNGSNLIVRAGGIRGLVVSLHDALSHVSARAPFHSKRCTLGTCPVEFGAEFPSTRSTSSDSRRSQRAIICCRYSWHPGGAVVMNAGTEVGAIWDVIECVRLLLSTGEMVDVGPEEVTVGYRFAALPEDSVVLEATLRQSAPTRWRCGRRCANYIAVAGKVSHCPTRTRARSSRILLENVQDISLINWG